MSNVAKKLDIHSLISIGIMVFARFIPVNYPFTPEGMMLFGIFIGSIYGIVKGNIFATCILALLLLGASDVTTVTAVFVSVLSNSVVMFLIFLFIFVGYLNSVGFASTLALKIVQSRVTKGRPWVLTMLLMFAAFLPSSFMSVTAVFLISLPLLYAICEQVGMERTDKWPTLTAIAMACACSFGLFFWPFQVGPAGIFGQVEAAGYEGGVPFLQYVLYMAVIVGLCILALTLVIKLLKPDISKLYSYSPPEEKVKFNSDQKFAGVLVIMLLVLFTVPQFLPAGTEIHRFFAQFGTFAIVAFLLALGSVFRKDGKARINVAEAAKGLQWPLVIMVGTILAITGQLLRPEFGFTVLITQSLGPIIGAGGELLFTIIVLLLAYIITNVLNAPTIAALMVPVVVPIAMASGFSVMRTMVPFMMVAYIGLTFPSAHPLAAIIHGHESIGPKPILKYIPLFMAVSFLIALLVGLPLSRILF